MTLCLSYELLCNVMQAQSRWYLNLTWFEDVARNLKLTLRFRSCVLLDEHLVYTSIYKIDLTSMTSHKTCLLASSKPLLPNLRLPDQDYSPLRNYIDQSSNSTWFKSNEIVSSLSIAFFNRNCSLLNLKSAQSIQKTTIFNSHHSVFL